MKLSRRNRAKLAQGKPDAPRVSKYAAKVSAERAGQAAREAKPAAGRGIEVTHD